MLTISKEELDKKAKRLHSKLMKRLKDKCSITVIDEFSEVGGGSMPMHKMPTRAIAISVPGLSIDWVEASLRGYKLPIIARIHKDRLIIDVRTVFEQEIDIVVDGLEWVLRQGGLMAASESEGMH